MTNAISFLWPYIDALWLPVLVLAAARRQWLVALIYGLAGMVLMRLMADFGASLGYGQGVLGLWSWPLFERGLLVFGLFNTLFAAMAYFARGRSKATFLTAGISFLFAAGFVFAVVMVL
ncbi:MAG: hypothetical protein L6Q57_09905 [Alphaproteobacteria bacterium]|nr:hypothetical protein [Alphaproteobacteria bacterium]